MTSSQQVYTQTNEALDTLSDVWESMLKVLTEVSAAAASSFTMEPDLDQLQKTRKEYEALLTQLKTKVAWIQEHWTESKQDVQQADLDPSLVEEHEQLQQVRRADNYMSCA
jgi:DNA repair ATPase RecN